MEWVYEKFGLNNLIVSGPTYCTLAPSRQRYSFNHQTVTITDAATPSPLDDPDIVYSAPLMMDFAVLSSSAQFGRLSVRVSPVHLSVSPPRRQQLAAHTKLLTLGRFLRPSVAGL